jgi:GT2 family glycosyltransferase
MNKIFILIPVFNRLNFTKLCLISLKNQVYRNFQTVVIDSGSTDGTKEFLARYYPEVQIIRGTNEWWWTKAMYEGVNKVLDVADGQDYILELNNDCFATPNYLKQVLETATKNPKAIVGSINVKAQDPTQVVEAGIKINWSKGLVYSPLNRSNSSINFYKNISIIKNVDALPGKGTLIPVKVFKDIGNFAVDRLPHYIADYEFSNRAKRAGYELIVDTKAILKHHWEATGDYLGTHTRVSWNRAWNLIFGRKSMNNIVDWINFIQLACPPNLRWKNYWLTLRRLFGAVICVYPFTYLRPIIKSVVRMFHFFKYRKWRKR